jgi:hypothetical protein
MAATTAEVARQLHAAFIAGPGHARQAIGGLFADAVELSHVPPLSSDGIVDGKRLAESTDREAASIGRAISDQRYSDIEVTVDDNEVRVTGNLLGTLATGTPVHLPMQMRCTIGDGQIVAIGHVMDGDAMNVWAEVAVAGGLVAAAKLLDDRAR